MNNKLHIEIAILTFSTLMIFSLILPYHVNAQPETFLPGSEPYGISYGEWSAKWWTWYSSFPKSTSPAFDMTGDRCSFGQNASSPVWYLVGTTGADATRSCTVPEGKSILISPINSQFVYAEERSPGTVTTPESVLQEAKNDIDKVTSKTLTVDKVEVPDLESYRVQSPLYALIVPEHDNVVNVVYSMTQEGTTQGRSDGYFVMLKPLPVGNHEIKSFGAIYDFTSGSPFNFVSDVTYKITVK